MGNMHRLVVARALFHPQRDSAGHEGSIQPKRGIVFARDITETIVCRLGCKGKKLGQRNAGIARVEITPTRFETSVDNSDSAGLSTRESWHYACRLRRFRQRFSFAHERA